MLISERFTLRKESPEATGSLADLAPELGYDDWRREVFNLTTASESAYTCPACRAGGGTASQR